MRAWFCGSACEQGELYQAILEGLSDEKIEEIALFYDYLEIQPLCNNQYLIREGRIEDRDGLIEINRKIVELRRQTRKTSSRNLWRTFLRPRRWNI